MQKLLAVVLSAALVFGMSLGLVGCTGTTPTPAKGADKDKDKDKPAADKDKDKPAADKKPS